MNSVIKKVSFFQALAVTIILVSGSNHKIELKSINKKDIKNTLVTLNQTTVARPIKINFFGEISYEEFKKN